MTHTIEELRVEREKLCSDIASLLRDFERKYDVKVTRIEYEHQEIKMLDFVVEQRSELHLEVEL